MVGIKQESQWCVALLHMSPVFFCASAKSLVSTTFRRNIEVEYHYIRIFIRSIALQAITDRSVRSVASQSSLSTLQSGYNSTLNDNQILQEVRKLLNRSG